MSSAHKYIYHLAAGESKDFPVEGWYFSDECEQLHGPYQDEATAIMCLDIYCRYEL